MVWPTDSCGDCLCVHNDFGIPPAVQRERRFPSWGHSHRNNSLERAGNRARTDDLLITNQLLYQLSYAGDNARSVAQ